VPTSPPIRFSAASAAKEEYCRRSSGGYQRENIYSSNFIIVALDVHDYEYQLRSLASPKHIQESFKVPMMYVYRYSVDFVESFCEKKLPCVQVLIEPGPVE
jgi:hypothetical protein